MHNIASNGSPNREQSAQYTQEILTKTDLAEKLISMEHWEKLTTVVGLSKRESIVARLIFEGKSRDFIAWDLGCAKGTVRTYVDRVYQKLNVGDRLELMIRLIGLHLTLTFDLDICASHSKATCDNENLR